jgi:hypothetical protein
LFVSVAYLELSRALLYYWGYSAILELIPDSPLAHG